MNQDYVVRIEQIIRVAMQEEFLRGNEWENGGGRVENRHRIAAIAAADLIERLSSPPEAAAVRPEVAAFALLMEQELRANDHKPGWKNDDIVALADRVLEEARELHDCASGYRCSRSYDDAFAGTSTDAAFQEGLCRIRRNLASEAADVANMAMMVADIAGALRSPKQGGE